MYVYAHTPLDEEPIKLENFSSVDKLCLSLEVFFGLKGLPNFFTKQMSSFLKTLIDQGFTLVYIDDLLILSNSKEHMFQLIAQLRFISTKHNLKLAPEKSYFMLFKVKFLGHEVGYNTVKPLHSKVGAIYKLPSPYGKVALMRFRVALIFYTKFIEKRQFNLKLFLTHHTKIRLGHGLPTTKPYFTNLKAISLLIQNLQYQIQNILFYYSRCFLDWIWRCPFPF